MLFPTPDPDALSDREREEARRNPNRATVILAAAGAELVLGAEHSVTVALSRASETMDRVDLWHARLALKTLRRDQREAIAEAVETEDRRSLPPPRPCAARTARSKAVRLG